ncbi:hypothetical protein [Methylobacterium brachiatum]|jgi:hypothetical protein|uniref:hypothetical protein n=1 Tax=Methylobacterium brachiatum TaxID=269660 RepID=UPI000EFBA6D9|nr:hypothetical protein [Methylobacterium brachiatum]AYO85313.1 hypothetical protein EBB05_25880 [Methylobacterium brachiatum]
MSDEKPRRRRRPAVPRAGLDLIAEGVAARVPPPIPPGLGEGLLEHASNGALMSNPQLDGLLGRLLERCEINGKQLEAVGQKMDRLEGKLEGVAYRRDIEHFMPRDEIERRIKEATADTKADGKEAVGAVRKDVEKLQGLVKWAGSGIIVSFAGLLLKLIYSSAHIPI